MKITKGKFIAFVDSYDYLGKNFLSELFVPKKNKMVEHTNDIFKIFSIPKFCYIWNKIYLREFIMQNNLFFREGVFYYYVYNQASTVATTKSNPIKSADLYNAWIYYNNYVIDNEIKSPLRFEKTRTIKFLGLPLVKIKEINDLAKQYYFCRLPIVFEQIKKNF